MSKPLRLSHSSVSTFTTCGRKYKLHYQHRLRTRKTHGALIFGSALDQAMNHLLKTKNLEESIKVFDEWYTNAEVNYIKVSIPTFIDIVYAERDFDSDLLLDEDVVEYSKVSQELFGVETKTFTELENNIKYFQQLKADKGIDNLGINERKLFNFGQWLSMRRKGHIMLHTYNKRILPKIKEVLAVQKQIEIVNDAGDSIIGFLDFAVEWEDGKRYILDNKTTYREYEEDSATRSQQLILYYHAEKQELKLDGVGYVVLYKSILKNKTKKCGKCSKDGTGQRHKTCDSIIDNERCNGEWLEKIKPEARIDVILNPVTEQAENLVIETFDEANEGIKKGAFGPNLLACNNGFKCQFYDYCWKGIDKDLVKLEEK